MDFGKHNATHDRLIPIWQLVYNGIILNNPFTETVNAPAKDLFTQTKLVEFNGRPTFYIYSKFKSDNKNWMGEIDLRCATDEELKQTAAFVKKGYDEFEALSDLQFQSAEQHGIAPNVFHAFPRCRDHLQLHRQRLRSEADIAPNRHRLFR